MVLISKDEKDIIHSYFPRVHITRTMKQKSKRHRYYCEEDGRVMAFLKKLRSKNVVSANSERGDRYTNRKKAGRVTV